MSSNKVSVIIPAWNSSRQLSSNLPSVIRAAKIVKAEIIIIDDASEDDSIKIIKDFDAPIRLYTHSSNRGFAATINEGVKHAKGDIVILLNSDVRPDSDCFVNAIKNFHDPSLFAVTFNSGEGWAAGKWEGGLLQHFPIKSGSSASLWASGGQAAFERAKWLKLEGMDTMFAPFYWEDVDLGYRAWKRGWKIIWDANSRCVHDHKQSVIRNGFKPGYVQNIAQRNQLIFVWKNIHDPKLISSHLAQLPKFVFHYPLIFISALKLLPQVLRSRLKEQRLSKISDQQVLTHWK